jgi:N-acetylneuraminic acid mutarotase
MNNRLFKHLLLTACIGLFLVISSSFSFSKMSGEKLRHKDKDESVDVEANVTYLSETTNIYTNSVFAPETVEFAFTDVMGVPRGSHTATLLTNGLVLIAGGYENTISRGTYISTAELYDPNTNQFTSTGNLNQGRADHAATLLSDDTVLITGGIGGPTLFSAEIYNPSTGTFTPTGDMNQRRSAHTATLLKSGKVLIAGGNSNTAELYDPSSGVFTPTGSMNESRLGHKASLLDDGRVLIVGGSHSKTAEIYDPTTGIFSITGDLSDDRAYPTASLLSNGNVLISGGVQTGDFNENYHSSTELFNPSEEIFVYTGSMNDPRVYHTASRLLSGSVLISGGLSSGFSGSDLNTTELYDPTSGKLHSGRNMKQSRYLHTQTQLPNGKILIAGGRGLTSAGEYDYLSSAEIGIPIPQNTFTGTLRTPSGWISTTSTVAFEGFTSGADLTAGALSNDGLTWGDWISMNEGISVTTNWNFGEDGTGRNVYLSFLDANGQYTTVVTGTVKVDQTPPATMINSLPDISPSGTISLTISGNDATSGINRYDLQVRSGLNGEWVDLITNATITSTTFTGNIGETYYFRSRATDVAGNVEPWPSPYDTFTLIGVGNEYGLTINGGDLFTNNTDVVLTISAKPGTREMQVSNDGGFANAEWEPYKPIKSWKITEYGSYVIPRTVYLRFKDLIGMVSSTHQDDIILDVTPPTGFVTVTPIIIYRTPSVDGQKMPEDTSASYRLTAPNQHKLYLPSIYSTFCHNDTGPANVVLHLQAEDDVSGVGSMMISNGPGFDCSQWEPYDATKLWSMPDGVTTVYVKYLDKAGNISDLIRGTKP